jgi:hypothetical protein
MYIEKKTGITLHRTELQKFQEIDLCFESPVFLINQFNEFSFPINLKQITNGVYFGVGAIFMTFDLTGKPSVLRKYKIQEGTNEPLEWDKFVNLVKQIVFNQVSKIYVGGPCT